MCHSHFEKFAQSRLEFVRNIAALAERPEYLEVRAQALCLAALFYGSEAVQRRRAIPAQGIVAYCCCLHPIHHVTAAEFT